MDVVTHKKGKFTVITVKEAQKDRILSFNKYEEKLQHNRQVIIDKFSELLDSGSKNFALNLLGCDYVDSGGIGLLIMLYKKITGVTKYLYIITDSSDVKNLIIATNLESRLKAVSSEDDLPN